MEYKIVFGVNEEINQIVNTMILQGWELFGKPFSAHSWDFGDAKIAQCLIKKDTVKE